MMKLQLQKLFNYIPYLLFLLAGILFLIMGNESSIPITIDGDDFKRESGSLENTTALIQEDSGYNGTFLTSSNYLLDKGTYTIGLAFNTDTAENSLTVYDNGKTVGTYPLDASVTYQEITFQLEKTSPDFQFIITYGGIGTLRVFSADLIPEGSFYHDAQYLIFLFLLGNILFLLWRYLSRKKNLDAKVNYTGLFLLGAGMLASLPYLQNGLNWAIDLCYHLIRIEGIKDGLLSGQFPVVIFPEALHGNGYLNSMYPNLFLYFPAFLRMLGISMADSYKTLVILFNLSTAFLTYHCIKTLGGTRQAAMLASLLYTCCPYRFTNVYARGALGEFLAMTFLPLLFTGLYHVLAGDKKKWGYLTLGMTGLLQTHILSVTLGGVFCAVFALLYIRQIFTEKRFVELLKAAVMSLLLNLGFLVAFFSFYRNGNLWVDALSLGTYEEYALHFSGILGTITTGGYHMLTLGIPLVSCAVIACTYLLLEHRKDKNDVFVMYAFILGVFLLFMLLPLFPGWRMMEIPTVEIILSKIQFAWRLLGPVSFLFALAGAVCLSRSFVLKEYSRVIFIVLAGICLLSVTRFRDEDFAYATGREYTSGHASKIIGIPKGENTVVFPYEWRPENTVDSGIITTVGLSDSTMINLKHYERQGVTTTLQYSCTTENQYMEIPVIFYPGYQAFDENGDEVTLETGYNNKIRVLLEGDRMPHEITVIYRAPLSFTVSAWISIVTAILWALWTIIKRKGKQTC